MYGFHKCKGTKHFNNRSNFVDFLVSGFFLQVFQTLLLLWLLNFKLHVGLTFIKYLALVKSPSVVWRDASGPTGTISFKCSKQWRRCALLFEKQKDGFGQWQKSMASEQNQESGIDKPWVSLFLMAWTLLCVDYIHVSTVLSKHMIYLNFCNTNCQIHQQESWFEVTYKLVPKNHCSCVGLLHSRK